jgi:putative oxidoreductase
MSTIESLVKISDRALAALKRIDWLPATVARATVGVIFLTSGWGKVHNLGKVTGFFAELGIPAPGLNAVVVSYSELVCGALLLVGLASRLATIPLLVSMAVALATAKAADIHGLSDLFGTVEFTYLALLLVIAVNGPGPLSADRLLARRFAPRAPLPATP